MKRRDFLKKGIHGSLGFGAGLILLSGAASVRGTEANSKVNLAGIGCGGRGRSLLGGFLKRDDVNVLYCCDLMKERGEEALARAMKSPQGKNAEYTSEMRKVLDDKNVDAVFCALPDHWHALGSVLACQAGKDVYTEKPASQSAWEGRKMVEAARKYKRIVQHGTQNRSAPYAMEAKKFIEEGKLGTIHLCKVYNQKNNIKDIRIVQGETVPEGFDWSAWLGPAADRPYSSTYTSSAWHDLWDFAGGDMLNDGVHQLDFARWLIGKEFPKSAYAVGGRFTDQSDGRTPDTLMATYEFDDTTMAYEQTLYSGYMLKTDPVVRESDMFPYWMQNATRIELFGTKGLMMVGRHGGGWQVFIRPKDRQPVVSREMYGRFPDPEHKENFIRCVRSRQLPNADIEIGHRSTLLVHYATISYRLGARKLDIDTVDGSIVDCPEAAQYWKRDYRAPYVIPENV